MSCLDLQKSIISYNLPEQFDCTHHFQTDKISRFTWLAWLTDLVKLWPHRRSTPQWKVLVIAYRTKYNLICNFIGVYKPCADNPAKGQPIIRADK